MATPKQSSRTIPVGGSTREPAPKGRHAFRFIRFIDLGTQKESFNGGEPKDVHKCNIALQLVNLETEEGKAVTVYKDFTYSAGPKANFGKMLCSWLEVEDASGINPETLLDKPGMCRIIHKKKKSDPSKVNDIIDSMEPAEGKVPKATEPLQKLFLDEEGWDQKVFDGLPEFIKKKIVASPEYVKLMTAREKGKRKK